MLRESILDGNDRSRTSIWQYTACESIGQGLHTEITMVTFSSSGYHQVLNDITYLQCSKAFEFQVRIFIHSANTLGMAWELLFQTR